MYSLHSIVQKTGADCAAIMVPHSAKPFLQCRESYNLHEDWADINNPLDNSTANGRVYLSGQPSLTEHYDKEFVGHFLSSAMVVPIKKADKTIGNLELIIVDQTKSFKRTALKDAQAFAKLVGDES